MGALLVASVSSFTSCKDYDDDINSLKESVAKAALQSNLDALTTQVNGIKTTADQALTTANAAATKSELSAAKTEALAKAAEGITNAATAQEAADAAKKLAQEAKDAVAAIDLSPYAKTTDVDGKIAEAAANAQTAIQTALADYVLASTLETRLAELKQEVADANEEQMTEMQTKVDNAVEGVKTIWSAVTNVSLFGSLVDGVIKTNGTTGSVNAAIFQQSLVYGRVNEAAAGYTTQVGSNTASISTKWSEESSFGKNDYYKFATSSSGKFNAGTSAKADRSVTFTHGDYVRPESSIIVRVSPASADLSTASFKFVDTKGENLNNLVEISKAEPYTTGDAISRAGSVTGLWKISFRLKDKVSSANLLSATKITTNSKIYALAVNNSVDQDENRYVFSEYDITFPSTTAFVGAKTLKNSTIYVNWWAPTLMTSVKGREDNTGVGVNKTANYLDYEWGTTIPALVAAGTARSTQTAYPVNNGQQFYVNAAGADASKIKYAYVIRDDQNANVQNDASELNAWNTYDIQGTGVLVEGSVVPLKVTIPGQKGDEVAFRLFAVNYDGTLADPDGLPFTVFVGNDTNASTVTATFHATKAKSLKKVFDITTAIASKATFANYQGKNLSAMPAGTCDANAFYIGSIWNPVNADPKITFKKANGTDNATKWSEAKKVEVEFSATDEMYKWADGKTANLTMTLVSGTPATTDWNITFALTKELPTADDVKALYSWKTGQLKNGVWKSVMYPESGNELADASSNLAAWTNLITTVGNYGAYKGLNNAINYLVDDAGNYLDAANPATDNPWVKAQVDGTVADGSDEGFFFNFENSAPDANNEYYTETAVVSKANPSAGTPVVNTDYIDGYLLQISQNKLNKQPLSKLIDDATEHASSVNFNFGLVSSEAYDLTIDGLGNNVEVYKDYTVEVEKFKTVYASPYHEITLTMNPDKSYHQDGDASKPIVEQPWNWVYYDDAACILGRGNKTVQGGTTYTIGTGGAFYSATSIKENKLITVSSKLGASFVAKDFTEFCKHLQSITGKFVSDANQTEEYFTVDNAKLATGEIALIKKPSTYQDPTNDIPSHLIITGVDAFGIEYTWSLPFTVKTTAVP
jgi:hypothetical protein